MRKTLALLTFACLALGGPALAQNATQAGCPFAPDVNDVEAVALAVQTYADAYNLANAHYLVGTSDPIPPVTISSPSCPPGSTTIGRAGYIGSFEGPSGAAEWPDDDGNDLNAIFVFDADDIVASARHYGMRFQNIQNFVGNAFTLTVKILENNGSSDFLGGRGVFNRTPVAAGNNATATGGLGPFGAPLAGVISTAITDTRHDRGDNHVGTCAIPARGTLGIHDSGAAAPPYTTFDRDADILLAPGEEDNPYRGIRNVVRAAQASTESYITCRHSCTPPLMRNVDCDVTVTNALYVGVSAAPGGDSSSAERLQDSLTVDNIIHLQGDSDFCAVGGTEGPDAVPCQVRFVSKL